MFIVIMAMEKCHIFGEHIDRRIDRIIGWEKYWRKLGKLFWRHEFRSRIWFVSAVSSKAETVYHLQISIFSICPRRVFFSK